jgi:hypothetical protein
MTKICRQKQNGLVVIRNGVMERIVPKAEYPDVIYEEDSNHFYLNGVGNPPSEDTTAIKVSFWNCNGWRGGDIMDKARFLAEMAKMEEVEMICLLDTRLDNLGSFRTCDMTCKELGKRTGKTWTSRVVARKDTMRVGGAIILHTMDWTNVSLVEVIKYGTITKIKGKWNGQDYVVVPIYRPCYGQSEGSMRLVLDLEYKGKFEDHFWAELKLACKRSSICTAGDDAHSPKQ